MQIGTCASCQSLKNSQFMIKERQVNDLSLQINIDEIEINSKEQIFVPDTNYLIDIQV
jgi:hypothetical protein